MDWGRQPRQALPQSVTVTLTDSFGNVATGYVGTVHFTSTDGQAVLPADYTFTTADQGKHTFQVTFKTAGSQSLAVTDSTNSSLKATANVNCVVGQPACWSLGMRQTATAGSPQSVTLTVTDSFGNVITGYVGTVHFTSTDGQAVLPADYTFTTADQGKHTFQVTFKTTVAQSISATDTANSSSLKANANVSVTTSAQLVVLDWTWPVCDCRLGPNRRDRNFDRQLRQRGDWLRRHGALHQHRRPSCAASRLYVYRCAIRVRTLSKSPSKRLVLSR